MITIADISKLDALYSRLEEFANKLDELHIEALNINDSLAEIIEEWDERDADDYARTHDDDPMPPEEEEGGEAI